MPGPENDTACAPVYDVSVVVPLVVAVRTTANAPPAVRVPDAGTTLKVGVGVVAVNPPVAPEDQAPRRASTV